MNSPAPYTPYQRRLLLFLSVATFFEGYDFCAITQVLPHIAREHGLDESGKGLVLSLASLGTMASYFVVRLSDSWGRRRTLALTIAGYTLATLATAFSRGVVDFVAAQLVARAFLIGEWAVSMVIAAEEFSAERRGAAIGLVQSTSTLGYIACVASTASLVQSPLGWRTVYLVGVVPLVLLAIARRSLRETERFAHVQAPVRPSLFRIFRSEHRSRMFLMAGIWALAYIAPHNAVSLFKVYAMQEPVPPIDEHAVGRMVALASVVAFPMVLATGKLIDAIGRRRGAAVIFGISALGSLMIYRVHQPWLLQVAVICGIFGASGYLPLLNAYTAELFPTELRGDAFAWSATFLGRMTYVISPFCVGLAVDHFGSYAAVMPWLAVFTLGALAVLLATLPETRGRELEETSLVH